LKIKNWAKRSIGTASPIVNLQMEKRETFLQGECATNDDREEEEEELNTRDSGEKKNVFQKQNFATTAASMSSAWGKKHKPRSVKPTLSRNTVNVVR